MGLVAGVLVVNLAFAGVGFALLAPALRSSGSRVWISFGGVAFMVGAAVVPVVLCAVAVAGGRTGLPAFAIVAGVLAASGVAAAVLLPEQRRRSLAPRLSPAPVESRAAGHVAATAAAALVAVLVAVVVGGFRTTPWLDDSWFMWLAKGVTLDHLGLDARMFVPNADFVSFTSPGYPWWWSIVGDLDVRAAGSIDMRALNAELALLLTGFVAAGGRLLWGRVRPSLLCCGLLLLVVSPELLRQAQGGGADVPVALFIGLTAIAAFLWLSGVGPLALGLAAIFAAAAIQTKDEGLPQIVILFAVASVFASFSAGARRIAQLWLAAIVSLLSALPWLVWRATHNVPSEVSLGDGFHRLAALDATDRLHSAATTLAHDVFSPRQWLILVPLALGLALAATVLTRRLLPLAVVAVLGLEFAFWLWVYWSTTDDLHYRLTTSAYRVVVTPLVLAALSLPLLTDALTNALRVRRGARPLWGDVPRAKID